MFHVFSVSRALFISSDSNHFTHSYIHQVDAHPCVGVLPEGLIDYCGLRVYRRPPAEGMRAITIGQINLHTLGHDKEASSLVWLDSAVSDRYSNGGWLASSWSPHMSAHWSLWWWGWSEGSTGSNNGAVLSHFLAFTLVYNIFYNCSLCGLSYFGWQVVIFSRWFQGMII